MVDSFLKKIKSLINSSVKNDLIGINRKIKEEILINNYSNSVLNSNEIGISDEKYTQTNIIISLTSYSKRVNNVYLTIESLFNQTLKPNKIILNLNSPWNENNIPETLKRQRLRGLEINFVEDFKSYDKLIHTLKTNPDDTIITCDDDVMYPFDFVEKFILNHIEDPNTILFYRGHLIKFYKDDIICPYNKWGIDEAKSFNNILNFPNGNCGILYPKNSLNDNVFDSKKFMKLAPNGDDIWFKAMSVLENTPVKKIELETHPFNKMIAIGVSQEIALWMNNINNSENDIQIKNVFEEFDIIKYLK